MTWQQVQEERSQVNVCMQNVDEEEYCWVAAPEKSLPWLRDNLTLNIFTSSTVVRAYYKSRKRWLCCYGITIPPSCCLIQVDIEKVGMRHRSISSWAITFFHSSTRKQHSGSGQ